MGRGVVALLLVLVTGACAPSGPADQDPTGAGGAPADLLVAAASDLRPAFEVLGERYTAATGTPVAFDFGSSGQLARRLIEGAPFDLSASADAAFVEQVLAAGVGDAATRRTYAAGRLVIWAPEQRWAGWEDLGDLAADEAVVTVAIANPDHAPYGEAAGEALVASGAIEALRDRLVFGEHVADAQRLAETGNADVGVLALSLALAAEERGVGRWVLVDEALHTPLQQDLVVTATDPDRARAAAAFVDLVAGEEGREVMRRYGFLLPGEEAPA